MDTLLFTAVADALAREIVGRKVGVVSNPTSLWVEIGVGRGTLVFILNPDNPVAFLSQRAPARETSRSHFAWVLEQHLKGGKIQGLFRCSGDRVMGMVVSVRDRIGKVNTCTLVAEIMGRHSNLVLLNQEGKVIEPLKKVHPDMSRVRHLLPGYAYHPPPPMPKRDPLTLNRQAFFELGTSSLNLEEAIRKEISLPGYAVGEILRRVGSKKGPEALLSAWEALNAILSQSKEGKGHIPSHGRLCTPFPIEEDSTELPILRAVERFFEERQRKQALDAARRELNRAIKRKMKSIEKALAKERVKSLAYAGEEARRYQRWGEVILIHLNNIPRGCSVLEVDDPFEPGTTISIPLTEGVPPAQTAQGYFNRASKIRRKQHAASKRLKELSRIREFLESLSWSVESAEELEELKELREELVREGLLEKGKARGKKREKRVQKAPYRIFTTPSGKQCLVGRHPKGNEEITFKVASRFDLWFHARDFPGAHVVLRGKDPSQEEIEKAASLAAP